MPLELDPELAAALADLSAGHEHSAPPPALGDVEILRTTVGEGIRHLAGPMPEGVMTTNNGLLRHCR